MALHSWSRVTVPGIGSPCQEAAGYLFNHDATAVPQAYTVSLVFTVAPEICSKWMELKHIVQSEVTQTHKNMVF